MTCRQQQPDSRYLTPANAYFRLRTGLWISYLLHVAQEAVPVSANDHVSRDLTLAEAEVASMRHGEMRTIPRYGEKEAPAALTIRCARASRDVAVDATIVVAGGVSPDPEVIVDQTAVVEVAVSGDLTKADLVVAVSLSSPKPDLAAVEAVAVEVEAAPFESVAVLAVSRRPTKKLALSDARSRHLNLHIADFSRKLQ